VVNQGTSLFNPTGNVCSVYDSEGDGDDDGDNDSDGDGDGNSDNDVQR